MDILKLIWKLCFGQVKVSTPKRENTNVLMTSSVTNVATKSLHFLTTATPFPFFHNDILKIPKPSIPNN